MEIQPTSNWWQKIKKFYTNNFPTDKQSCAILSTFISTTLSSLNFMTLTSYPYYMCYEYVFQGFCIALKFSTFLLITACANYFLYGGLLSDEWKKISLVIILKLVEIAWCSGNLIFILCSTSYWFISFHFNISVSYPSLIVLDVLYTWCLLRKVKEMKKRTAPDNICAMNDFIEIQKTQL